MEQTAGERLSWVQIQICQSWSSRRCCWKSWGAIWGNDEHPVTGFLIKGNEYAITVPEGAGRSYYCSCRWAAHLPEWQRQILIYRWWLEQSGRGVEGLNSLYSIVNASRCPSCHNGDRQRPPMPASMAMKLSVPQIQSFKSWLNSKEPD